MRKVTGIRQTRNTILPSSDDENGLNEMFEAYGEAKQCVRPDDSTPGVYVCPEARFIQHGPWLLLPGTG